MFKSKVRSQFQAITPARFLAKIVVIIAVVEASIMWAFAQLPKMPEVLEGILDATILAVVSAVPIWFVIIRPLKKFISVYLFYLESLEQALDSSAIVAITDTKGVITHCNKKFQELSGYDQAELIGQNHRIINSGLHDRPFFIDLWKTIHSGAIWTGEIRNRRKDGSHYWVDSTIVPIRDQNGNVSQFVSIRFDITQRKKIEAALIEAKIQSESASRAKAQFLANMSHEIRTPMNGLLGMTALLADENLSAEGRRHIEVMKTSGDTLLTLINDILDFSKIEANKLVLEKVEFNLALAIRQTVAMMRHQADEKGLEISMVFANDLPTMILADVTRLRQVLLNLISNAIKFTPHGKIKIITSTIETHGQSVDIQIDVVDSGIGLDEPSKQNLFKPFSQVDGSTTRRFGGTGLGLAICRGICDAMGGKIWVESVVGAGSTFSFTFKAVVATESQKNAGKIGAVPDSRNEKPTDIANAPLPILIADDNATNQLLAKRFLEKLGYSPDVVNNGREAIDQLNKRRYAVVFMDCHMPELDGFEATAAIHRKLGVDEAPWIIALTASTSAEDRERCRQTGMNDFVAKPFSIDDLRQAMNRAPLDFLVNKLSENPQTPESHAENKLYLVNESAFRSAFADSHDIALELIEAFLASLPSFIKELDHLIEKQDLQALSRLAHKMKGSIGHFSPPLVTARLEKIEEACEKKDFASAAAECQILKTMLDEVPSELAKLRLKLTA